MVAVAAPPPSVARTLGFGVEASATPHWPPPTREFLVNQETKILVPAAFSPQA